MIQGYFAGHIWARWLPKSQGGGWQIPRFPCFRKEVPNRGDSELGSLRFYGGFLKWGAFKSSILF